MSKKNPPLTVDSIVDKYTALVDKYDALTDKYLALKGDKTERELMLCQQVLRMCRGEASEFNDDGLWKTVINRSFVSLDFEYRAKPKKELIVPWEWLPDDVTELTITVNKVIYNNRGYTVALKLDLTDTELPVTVERPKC